MPNIPAYKVTEGVTLADGRRVTSAAIHERNEWLTVHIKLDDGSTIEPAFYTAVEIADARYEYSKPEYNDYS